MRPLQILFVLFFCLSAPCAQARNSARATGACATLLQAPTLDSELAVYRYLVAAGKLPTAKGTLQRFAGVGNRLVYNPTGQFLDNGLRCLAARVEALHDERQTEVMFFERGIDGIFRPIPAAPVFRMQDPFLSNFGDEIVFGGVETFLKPDGVLGYRTLFYRGADIYHLKSFAVGPAGMKDIRLAKMPGGTIVLATRPQKNFHPQHPELDAGPGTIGMTMLQNLSEFSEQAINDAPLFPDLLPKGSWGGINDLRPLDDRYVGVLGHVANYGELRAGNKERDRNYYPFVALWDTQTRTFSKMKIILERSDLPAGFSKRKDLRNVLFSGALDPESGVFWVGGGDAQVIRVRLGYNPFDRLRRP